MKKKHYTMLSKGFPSKVVPIDKHLNIEELRRYMETRLFGLGDQLVYFPSVDSTNTRAVQLAHERSGEGVVLLADNQTAGKGRQGRHWVDVFGDAILSSTILRPLFPLHMLIMVASLAVVASIAEICKIAATIKWPNDVIIENRKVAGILIETSHDQDGALIAVLGIGINVNGSTENLSRHMLGGTQVTNPTPKTATTLETECGHMLNREALIARLLFHIETDYLALQQEGTHSSFAQGANPTVGKPASRLIRERWRSQLSHLGSTVQVRQGETVLHGVAEGVNDNGEMLLRRHSGELVRIAWGDVGYPDVQLGYHRS